jgi:hypothetical protein
MAQSKGKVAILTRIHKWANLFHFPIWCCTFKTSSRRRSVWVFKLNHWWLPLERKCVAHGIPGLVKLELGSRSMEILRVSISENELFWCCHNISKVVINVVISFSRTIMCLEDMARSLRKEWYLMHSVSAISVQVTLGPCNSTWAEEDETGKEFVYMKVV